jgi:fructose-bisphosphate aldolase class II/tagatose 1,6-diphosphate aldolase GatY/KbaY
MLLMDSASLARKARENGYAVPALNTNGATYDIARAVIEAAAELDAPLIVQCYEPNMAYRGADYFVDLVKRLASQTQIPIAIQLDQGKRKRP